MKKPLDWLVLATLVAFLCMGGSPLNAFADGTEILGPPGIPIVEGSGIVAAGIGLHAGQPGTINITVPAGATINQVLMYWEGQMIGDVPGDNSILVDGNPVAGTLIGGQTFFFNSGGNAIYSSAFRADITNLGLITAGANSVSVDGVEFTFVNNGAGILVIFDEDTASDIQLRDGLDLAFYLSPGDLQGTVAQTFNFAAVGFDRTVTLSMFFSSVEGPVSGGGFRQSSIEITVGGVTEVLSDLLFSNNGPEWDTLNLDILIPAGATSLTVQAFSRDDDPPEEDDAFPASLGWIAAGLSVPLPEPCIDIAKLVSVDGGVSFVDADDCAQAPTTDMSAEYNLIVTNCGPEALENVVINDADLGIMDFLVGYLPAGDNNMVELDRGDIGELFYEGLCEMWEQFENTAAVAGTGVISGTDVTDSDPACVVCSVPEPCIDIEKLVSVDGGVSFEDADDCAEAPTTDMSAEYKLIVTNCGDEDLENVLINDVVLGITDFPVGNLAVLQSIELLAGDIPELFFEDLCSLYEQFENIASATGSGIRSQTVVMDEDPACVVCEEEEGCVGSPGYWSQHPDAWPVEEIMIDCDVFSKAEAIEMMQGSGEDKWITMFRAYAAATLNVISGSNDECVYETIEAAEDWLCAHPSPVNAGGPYSPWRNGEPLYRELDRYNNGQLCAPKCESVSPVDNEPEEGGEAEDQNGGEDANYARIRMFLLWLFAYLHGLF